MPGLDVKMNYSSMENMEKAFQQAAQQIQESISAMGKVHQTLEGGALLGQAGTAFAEAISSKLSPTMKTIAEGMTKLQQDIGGAVSATRDGVTTATSRFK